MSKSRGRAGRRRRTFQGLLLAALAIWASWWPCDAARSEAGKSSAYARPVVAPRFAGPLAARLNALIDASAADTADTARATLAEPSAPIGDRLFALLVLIGADRDLDADTAAASLSSDSAMSASEQGQLLIVQSMAAYKRDRFSEARALLDRGFDKLGPEKKYHVARLHLTCQIRSSAREEAPTAECLKQLDAGNAGLTYPFTPFPDGADWDVPKAAWFLALKKRYGVLWDELSSRRMERNVYGGALAKYQATRKEERSALPWSGVKLMMDMATTHDDKAAAADIGEDYLDARLADGRFFQRSRLYRTIAEAVAAHDVEAGRTDSARRVAAALSASMEPLKADDPQEWMLQRFEIDAALDLPTAPAFGADRLSGFLAELRALAAPADSKDDFEIARLDLGRVDIPASFSR